MGQILTGEMIDAIEERTLKKFENKRRRRSAVSGEWKRATDSSTRTLRRFMLKDQRGNMALATALLFISDQDPDLSPVRYAK